MDALILSDGDESDMPYLTEDRLRAFADSLSLKYDSQVWLKDNRFEADVSIFLSHSHSDKELVEGFVKHLSSLGLDVYVDWKDPSMPSETSGETADRIKRRIGRDDIFMMLATESACKSRWVPWELGIADDRKDRRHIYIVPVKDRSGRFHGNEYLQVYRHLEVGEVLKEHSHRAKLQILEPTGVNRGRLHFELARIASHGRSGDMIG